MVFTLLMLCMVGSTTAIEWVDRSNRILYGIVSALDPFGLGAYTALILILAVGAGEERPIVVKGQVVIAHMMSVTLAVDHRAVDGALGAEWLRSFKAYVEKPATMLL